MEKEKEKKWIYESTSEIFVNMRALPPVDWTSCFSHTKHLTSVVEHPNTICSAPQFKHLILRNRLFGWGTNSFWVLFVIRIHLVYFAMISNFLRRWAFPTTVWPHFEHLYIGRVFLLAFAWLCWIGFGWPPYPAFFLSYLLLDWAILRSLPFLYIDTRCGVWVLHFGQ